MPFLRQSAISIDMNANDDLIMAAGLEAQAPHFSRPIALEGASNFRDLGGYQGLDGRRLQWRKLYRSAHLAHLTQDDLNQLKTLGVSRSADFRGLGESAHLAYNWPQLSRHALIVEPTVVQRAQSMIEKGQDLTAGDTVELMHDTYRSFVNVYGQRFAEFFELLQTNDDPLVFHCTAGKDRTGLAAALLLSLAGVPREAIVADYTLTETNLAGPFSQALTGLITGMGIPLTPRLTTLATKSPASAIETALDWIAAEHGDAAAYLRSGGLSIDEVEALRRVLLAE